jgi:hypothetical protein
VGVPERLEVGTVKPEDISIAGKRLGNKFPRQLLFNFEQLPGVAWYCVALDNAKCKFSRVCNERHLVSKKVCNTRKGKTFLRQMFFTVCVFKPHKITITKLKLIML